MSPNSSVFTVFHHFHGKLREQLVLKIDDTDVALSSDTFVVDASFKMAAPPAGCPAPFTLHDFICALEDILRIVKANPECQNPPTEPVPPPEWTSDQTNRLKGL